MYVLCAEIQHFSWMWLTVMSLIDEEYLTIPFTEDIRSDISPHFAFLLFHDHTHC